MNVKLYNWLIRQTIPIVVILSFLLCCILSLFSIKQIQGDARVINYTGIVRGATQRLVKQELNQMENDTLIKYLDTILNGLSQGDSENDLLVLKSDVFHQYLAQMQQAWSDIKLEIQAVRAGKDSQTLFNLSESYFELADKAVSEAESYSEQKVQNISYCLLLLSFVIIVFVIIFCVYRARQEKMVRQLQAAESASKEKSEFLSRMSHEIRTPMNGIAGMIEIASRSLDNPLKLQDCLHKIKISSDYLLSLINDILDMARIESGKVALCCEAFSLKNLLDRLDIMFSQKAEAAKLQFEIKTIHLYAPDLIGDELRLSQVVVNLVSNAIKFTPPNGKVKITVEEIEEDANTVLLKIDISDTGIGMTNEFQTRMFEPFEQAESITARQYGGTGLGLAISQSLIAMMGGSIAIHSILNEGTQFTIELKFPRAQESESDSNTKKRRLENLQGYHILLAEDNEINTEIAVSLLESFGAAVECASNGEEALQKFLVSVSGTFQLILMDVQMPVMNGLQASQAIRNCAHPQGKTIPIIGLSANAFQQDMENALQCGMNAYISKPIDLNQLMDKISELC